MFIGIGTFEIFIPASTSLKDKRQVLRPIVDTVRKRFNVSIAEVGYQELWQRAAFGVTCVAGEMAHCRKVLQEVEKAIGRSASDGAEIVDRSVDVFALEDL
ncbi:MAG TPA: DUF503 domain-containing protein [Actinomycetota bacterium]|jgi:uncharacterized protein YlxP (DUF503 family)|nr:DUF503 domain-containing protein [Actinomycetota bacterium]